MAKMSYYKNKTNVNAYKPKTQSNTQPKTTHSKTQGGSGIGYNSPSSNTSGGSGGGETQQNTPQGHVYDSGIQKIIEENKNIVYAEEAPPGLSYGTVVRTKGGDYKIVAPNTPGANYNPNTGYWSIKEGTPSTSGYDNVRISQDKNMQGLIDDLYNLANKKIKLDPTLSWQEAFARAKSSIGPAYAQAFDAAMKGLDENALRTGFFGQLPTEALKREAAGKLEADKLQAINDFAAQLFGQSEESAYRKLDAQNAENQNKVNTMLQLLGIYQNERGYLDSREDADWEKKYKEAALTGAYNGQPTLDFLQEQRIASGKGGSGGGGSSGGGSKTSTQKPSLTAAQARTAINDAIKAATTINPETGAEEVGLPVVSQKVVDAYNYWYGTDYYLDANSRMHTSKPKVTQNTATTGGKTVPSTFTYQDLYNLIVPNRTPEGRYSTAKKLVEQGANEDLIEQVLKSLGLY